MLAPGAPATSTPANTPGDRETAPSTSSTGAGGNTSTLGESMPADKENTDLDASIESDDGLAFWTVSDDLIIDHVVENHSRQERLLMVAELLKMELREAPGSTKNFIRALGHKFETKRDDPSLPASSSLTEAFKAYTDELGARNGSVRAKKRNPAMKVFEEEDQAREIRDAYDITYLPKFFRDTGRPQLDRYPTTGVPWRTVPPAEHDEQVLNTSLYPGRTAPILKCSLTQVREWESISREALTVMSHLDMFLSASGTLFKDLYSDVTNRRDTDASALFTHARLGINLNYAMALAIQDLTKSLAWVISDMTVLRRDRWLQQFDKKVPRELLIKLRTSDVNNSCLLDPTLLEEAKAAAEKKAEKKSQHDLQKAHVDSIKGFKTVLDTFSTKSSQNNGNNNNKKFGKRPWQDRHQNSNQSSDDSKRPRQDGGQQNDRRPQKDYNNAREDRQPFRGNRGRGRGRGKFSKGDGYRNYRK